MKRYRLDPILESMEEDAEGEWVRWEDVKAGRSVVTAAPAAPASSELGIELSKIRDRLNALEVMHEGQPEKTTRWERAIEERIEVLEKRTGGRMRLS